MNDAPTPGALPLANREHSGKNPLRAEAGPGAGCDWPARSVRRADDPSPLRFSHFRQPSAFLTPRTFSMPPAGLGRRHRRPGRGARHHCARTRPLGRIGYRALAVTAAFAARATGSQEVALFVGLRPARWPDLSTAALSPGSISTLSSPRWDSLHCARPWASVDHGIPIPFNGWLGSSDRDASFRFRRR